MHDSADQWENPAPSTGPTTESPGSNIDCVETGGLSPDDTPVVDESTVRRIQDLPREVGVMLITVGALGVVLPGMMGTPAIIAGGLVLWPGTFGKVENWFRRRNPGVYHRGVKQLGRFLDDLERRYPELTKK